MIKNKAFISATPTIPSDPRFEFKKFKHVYIKPDYDFRQNIKLIHTNNIQYTFKKFIEDNPRDQYFVFLNSTDSIAALITELTLLMRARSFAQKKVKEN